MYTIDAMSRQPVYEQLSRQIERFVLRGALKMGEQLPSVRSLSMRLAVNPNTVQKAYTELERRGVLVTVPGKGCFVAADAAKRIGERKRRDLTEFTEQVREFAMAGIEKGLILNCVDQAYEDREELS